MPTIAIRTNGDIKIEEEPFVAESEQPAGGPTLLADTDETAAQIKEDNGQATPTDSNPLLLKSSQTNSTAAQPEILHQLQQVAEREKLP